MDEIQELDLKKVLHTLTSVNSARPQLESTVFGPQAQDPPGNFYAANIKSIQDDSRSVFPESVYSGITGRRKRWSSTYENHYIPRQEQEFDKWMKEYMSLCPGEKPGTAPAFMSTRDMGAQSKPKESLQLTERDKVRHSIFNLYITSLRLFRHNIVTIC